MSVGSGQIKVLYIKSKYHGLTQIKMDPVFPDGRNRIRIFLLRSNCDQVFLEDQIRIRVIFNQICNTGSKAVEKVNFLQG